MQCRFHCYKCGPTTRSSSTKIFDVAFHSRTTPSRPKCRSHIVVAEPVVTKPTPGPTITVLLPPRLWNDNSGRNSNGFVPFAH